jgi:hypothetical protein
VLRRTPCLVALAGAAVAVALALAAGGAPGEAGAAEAEPPVRQVAANTGRARDGQLGYGRLFPVEQPLPRALFRSLQRRFRSINPGEGERSGDAAPGPATAPTADTAGDGPLDSRRRSDPPNPPAPKPGGRVGILGAPRPAGSKAADDFTLFRSTPVAQGTGITTATGEPSVANDRNAVLFTGNFHAAVSGDNGLSWSYLNPATQFPSVDGGFCCDQVAYAVDRGPYSLVFWLLQYSNDGVVNPTDGANGRLRLVVYQGRDELLEQSDYCTMTFKPSDFGFPANTWFDFNQMSHTREYLYISSKVQTNLGDPDGDGQFNSQFQNGVVWRMRLDDLDSDDCRPTFSYVGGTGAGFNPALVQGAGDETTMHWASHGSTTTTLQITRLDDSASTAYIHTKTIASYLSTQRPPAAASLNGNCVLPDGTDPCLRINDAVNIGWTNAGGNIVGWFWNVRQGSGYPFPHVRGARFLVAAKADQSPVRHDEPDIWSPDHAFFYPTVGVNDAGDLGITVYRAGNGKLISARAALVDSVNPNIDSLSFNGIVTSDSGVANNTWGDYQSVRPYGNCTGSFVASVHSMQGGSANGNAEHRFAWFGREDEGCADLAMVDVAAYRVDLNEGESLLIGSTTRNIGSGNAGESRTRFYLSRNASKSPDDLLLDDPAVLPVLGRGVSYGDLAAPPVPPAADGTYHVLACADDREKVDEISDTNNCVAAPETVTVEKDPLVITGHVLGIDIEDAVRVLDPGDDPDINVDIDPPPGGFPVGSVVSVHLSPTGSVAGSTRVDTYPVAGIVDSRQKARSRGTRLKRKLRLSRGITRRRQFVIACIGPRAVAARCLASRTPVYIRGVKRR